VVVDRGRVLVEGTIDDLTAGSDPVLEIDVPSDPDGTWAGDLDGGGAQVVSVAGGRVRMTLRPGPGSAAERAAPVLDRARAAGPVSHFAFQRRSLAEVFLAMVGRPVELDEERQPLPGGSDDGPS
jgi:hypothetical protein